MIAAALTNPPPLLVGLFVLGMLIGVISSVATVLKAFGKSFIFGVVCAVAFFIPFGTFIFAIIHRAEFTRLLYAQILALALVAFSATSVAVQFQEGLDSDPAPVAASAQVAAKPKDKPADKTEGKPTAEAKPTAASTPAAKIPDNVAVVQPSPSVASTPGNSSSSGSATFISARDLRVKELYFRVSQWYADLKARRPGPSSTPEQITAFNEEYAQYEALLAQYKEEIAQLQKERAAAARSVAPGTVNP